MKYSLGLISALFCMLLTGQTFDDMISKNRYIDCQDVSFNASKIIRGFYSDNEINKIYNFLDYWQEKCGSTEVVNRFRTILDINRNAFSPRLITEETIEDLMFYKMTSTKTLFSMDTPSFYVGDSYQTIKEIDNLTRELARSSSAGSVDGRLFLDFYSEKEPSFTNIKAAPETSNLKRAYDVVYKETLNMWEWHLAFMAGFVDHYGNIELFGLRPSVGFIGGGRILRHNLDVVFDVRIGPSENEYTFVYQGNERTEDTWTSFYIGGEYTYDFLNTDTFTMGISPGLGYENITAVDSDEDDTGDEGKFLPSFNRNIGLVLKYRYGKRGGYVGLHARYHWADFENEGGTRLDGEYLNLRLTIGNIFNSYRDDRLKQLD